MFLNTRRKRCMYVGSTTTASSSSGGGRPFLMCQSFVKPVMWSNSPFTCVDFCFSPLTFSLNEYDDFNILLLLYVCRENVGVIMSNENQNMKWLFVKDLYDCNLLPADRELIPYIRDSVLT